jgi:putative ABC transport system substrate-binding protein
VERRAFIAGTLGLLAAPLTAEAQPAAKVPKIGYLSPWSSSTDPFRVEAFRDALREHGYVDGTNVVVVPRFADEDPQRVLALAAELVKLQADVIVALTTPVARVVQRVTVTIPTVFTYVSDAVRTGLVASLARPGGNLTGYSDITADLVQKRLGLLKEVLPRVTRVGVLKNPGNPGTEIVWRELESAARQLDMELYGRDVKTSGDFDGAFAALTRTRVGCVILLADYVFVGHRQAIARLATSRQLPLMGWSRPWSEAGALLSYGANTRDVQRRVASYVAKILKGAKPADLPVEEATRFDFVINMKTAKALGLTIPPSVLARADEVIE